MIANDLGPVVRKAINANPWLKVNHLVFISLIKVKG